MEKENKYGTIFMITGLFVFGIIFESLAVNEFRKANNKTLSTVSAFLLGFSFPTSAFSNDVEIITGLIIGIIFALVNFFTFDDNKKQYKTKRKSKIEIEQELKIYNENIKSAEDDGLIPRG